MPKHVAKKDHRFQIATGFARKYHGMPIKEAMKLAILLTRNKHDVPCKWSSAACCKRQRAAISTPPPSAITVSTEGTPVLSVTNRSGTNEEAVVVSNLTAPKVKRQTYPFVN